MLLKNPLTCHSEGDVCPRNLLFLGLSQRRIPYFAPSQRVGPFPLVLALVASALAASPLPAPAYSLVGAQHCCALLAFLAVSGPPCPGPCPARLFQFPFSNFHFRFSNLAFCEPRHISGASVTFKRNKSNLSLVSGDSVTFRCRIPISSETGKLETAESP